MGNKFFTYRKDRLSKLFLSVTILLSIFALFPSINKAKIQQQKTQTEIGCSLVKSAFAKTAYYKNIKAKGNSSKKIIAFHKYQTSSLLFYNKQVNVRLHYISARFLRFEKAAALVQLKTIPKSSPEDNRISITG